MTKFIKKAILFSFASLAVVSLTSQLSYGADSKDIPTNQPTPAPKLSVLQKLFGSCLGCLKATEDAVEDIQDITPVVIKDGQDIINQVDDIIKDVGKDTNSKVAAVVNEQEKVKKMTKKIRKKNKDKDA